MLAVANYVLKGPKQAFIATLLFSALTAWLAPFGVLVGAIIALITLRIGTNEGFKTLLIAGGVNTLISVALFGSYWSGIVSVIEYMLPVWIAALVLRTTNSLASALNMVLLMVGIAVLGFHFAVGNPEYWWSQLYAENLQPLLQEAGVDTQTMNISQMVSMMTLLLAIFAVVLWYSILLLGRWWQGKVYYPGRFQEDFYQLRLPKNIAYMTVVFAILGLIWQDNALIRDLSGVLMAGLMFQGLAIAHHAVGLKAMSNGWLIGLYVLLLFFPQTILILATVGLLDIWLNFRVRWQKD